MILSGWLMIGKGTIIYLYWLFYRHNFGRI